MIEDAFLAMLYHTHHSLEAHDLSFWLHWAKKQGGPILELGCGTGRVLIPLAEAGHTIFGLDYDPAMLDQLRVRLSNSIKNRVALVRGDLRRYCLAARFPLILMPCNTYSTLLLEDRQVALHRARLHLAAGGVLIISLPNPSLLSDLPDEGQSENESIFTHPQTGNPVQASSQWERVGSGIHFHWHYDYLLPDGRIERHTLSATHHIQDVREILQDFDKTGFDILHTYGDFDSSSFNMDSSSLIVVAQST